MAKPQRNVLLGFVDEEITDKYKGQINFGVNKIGGLPDFPNHLKVDLPKCPLCQLERPLVIQIFAPLDNSSFHRTLYLFACINPNCWTSSKSWLCMRIQIQEQISNISKDAVVLPLNTNATDWCADAEDWGENEENGNEVNNSEMVLDAEEESCSIDDSLQLSFEHINVDDETENGNKGAQVGAVGRLSSPVATAEIEGNEGEVICIDTPLYPQRDIIALMQEVTPVPQELFQLVSRGQSVVQFTPYFMSVWEETSEKYPTNITDSHVKELLQDYQQKNIETSDFVITDNDKESQQMKNFEKYEKSTPAHGDKMFHRFLSKIQMNPGQILRHDRESSPLLPYPIPDVCNRCQYCQGDLVFEFQILPTIISKLKLVTDSEKCDRLEFGTVLVYTCRKSCWNTDNSMCVEHVILQKETY